MRRLVQSIARRPWRSAAAALAALTMFAVVAIVTAPWFGDVSTYGFHDWDVETSFRYLVKISLLEYGEFPGWNPYACGGYPSWGFVEGATNLVSPWLPVYLWAPLPLAIRIETVGMGLLGAAGAYAIASCFTKSHGARLLVAVLWAVNGRWALQIAAGHVWHLAYAYLPWCMFFFERACDPQRRRTIQLGMLGVCFAMMVYAGGIYRLPHAVLLLTSFALLRSWGKKTLRPLWVLALGGAIGVGLAAPKLLPMLDTFAADPRHIASNERLSLGALVTLLTHPVQHFHSRPARVWPYGWHEWGMYISPLGAMLCAYALLFGRGTRIVALRLVGVLFVLLGLGAFHRWAPWTLLHSHVPLFRSQHVPSRFLYPALLLLALVVAVAIGRLVERRMRRQRWLDVALVVVVAALGVDVARVAQQPMRAAMWMVPPEIPRSQHFSFDRDPDTARVRRVSR